MTTDFNFAVDETIRSQSEIAIELIRRVLDYLESARWSENDVFGIHMALEEALMNAIKHGNQNDPKKQIHIIVQISDQQFRAQITDEGSGFDLSKVPDPTLDENLEKNCGRGISLIRLFMDQIDYNQTCNSITMCKNRHTP